MHRVLWVSQATEKDTTVPQQAGGHLCLSGTGRPDGAKVMLAKDQEHEEFRLMAVWQMLYCPAMAFTHGNSQSSSSF